jgi:formamidopyrimidine-DNA glycosylase
MPELPEVETVRRGLEPVMAGKTLKTIDVHRQGLRVPFPANLKSVLEGRRILDLTRRAKYILVRFEGGGEDTMVIHLGMSGRMTTLKKIQGYNRLPHDHMVITMQDGQGIVFNDARRFGMVLLARGEDLDKHPAFRLLGPEPLSRSFTAKVLKQRLKGKKPSIKAALLDQRVVAGIGNIYACEALYEARIDPRKAAGALSSAKCDALVDAVKNVLNRSIKAGGSSLKDYRKADGELGYFQHSFLVYDREGQPCPRCAASGKKKHTVKRFVQAGRSTFYCPGCQT